MSFTKTLEEQLFWTPETSLESFSELQELRINKALELLNRLVKTEEPHTVENTLTVYDEIGLLLGSAGAQAHLMENVHPDADFRTRCEVLSQKISKELNALSLNRKVYDALSAMDISAEDDATKHYVTKTLNKFRLSGVDKDDETRERIKQLNEELVTIEQQFARNIREDKRTIIVDDAETLSGLPKDFIDSHPADEAGNITLTTNYTDSIPVFSYAKNSQLRKDMYYAMNNRAYPINDAVLKNLCTKRFELANLLGFKNYADYITADKMIGNAQNASDFISKIVAVASEKAYAEYDQLLLRKKGDESGAEQVFRWESSYYQGLVEKESYNFDSQSVRPFYPYNRVKQGVLDVAAKLFGVEFKLRRDLKCWHPKVECWDMLDNGETAGRFYLDMHPRENKYSHAAQFEIEIGVRNTQIPQAALVCNFPETTADNPGLMEQTEVQTFFHEFGHLLHTLFAANQQWAGIGGISTEWDFVEAPSQMLEEWARNAIVLQSFAVHFETNQPIPTELVEQMNRASRFGKGLFVLRQMEFARLSLSLHDRAPEEIDADKMVKEIADKYSPFPFAEKTHFQDSFGHLTGYSAIYYTYMWSLVLAKDLFSAFDPKNLLEPAISFDYRRKILEAGGSLPAKTLVENFLERESNFDAYETWLNDAN